MSDSPLESYASPLSSGFLASSLTRDNRGTWRIPCENDEGSVEYKLRLVGVTEGRLVNLVTQLRWRLSEGHGTCLYELGVADDGELVGLSEPEMDASVATLKRMCEMADAEISQIRRHEVDFTEQPVEQGAWRTVGERCRRVLDEQGMGGGRLVAECVVRRIVGKTDAGAETGTFKDVRIAVVGCVDAGKSTLLGVLSHGEPDNARGRARLSLLRHPHELITGRTSSLSHQLIGFSSTGVLNNFRHSSSWEAIVERSGKVVELMDTCGHSRYLRTTISALSGWKPDYACLVVPVKRRHSDGTEKEIAEMCEILGIPVFVVVSKVDLDSWDSSAVLQTLSDILPGKQLAPLTNTDDITPSITSFASSSSTPIFQTSSVTGDGLPLLLSFLRDLPKPAPSATTSPNFSLQIEQTYNPPDVGTVISGIVLSGSFTLDSQGVNYWLGPVNGEFVKVGIGSVHRQRVPVRGVGVGEAASLAIFASDGTGQADIEEAARKKRETEKRDKEVVPGMGLFGPDDDDDDDSGSGSDAGEGPNMFSFEDPDSDEFAVPDLYASRRSPISDYSTPPKRPLASTLDLKPRKGQILLSLPETDPPPTASREFVADIVVHSLPALSSSHSTSPTATTAPISHIGLTVGTTGTALVGSVRQPCTLVSVLPSLPHEMPESMPALLAERVLYVGQKARATIRWTNEPEYLEEGWKLVFRHGKVLVSGVVVAMV